MIAFLFKDRFNRLNLLSQQRNRRGRRPSFKQVRRDFITRELYSSPRINGWKIAYTVSGLILVGGSINHKYYGGRGFRITLFQRTKTFLKWVPSRRTMYCRGEKKEIQHRRVSFVAWTIFINWNRGREWIIAHLFPKQSRKTMIKRYSNHV